MKRSLLLGSLLGLGLIANARVVAADPDPAPQAGKVDARSLMQSGVRLLEAKDYLGALAVFQNAYARFPSAKILLNIGTTQTLLDHKADAANSYQKYLDSADADPTKKADVSTQLAELDKAVGILDITVTPGDAELLVAADWQPAAQVHAWRVTPGEVSVKARKQGYSPSETHTTVAAGAHQPVAVALVALPVAPPQFVVAAPIEEGPRSRFGAFVLAHVSVIPKLGSAVFVGATADVTEQLAFEAAVILGPGIVSSNGSATLPPPKLGAYAGASYTVLSGHVRPRLSVGLPVFFSDGAKFVARGAAGLEYVSSAHLSFELDLGAEVDLNPPMDIRTFALVPSLGVVGRL
jgi:hypothetical protein